MWYAAKEIREWFQCINNSSSSWEKAAIIKVCKQNLVTVVEIQYVGKNWILLQNGKGIK